MAKAEIVQKVSVPAETFLKTIVDYGTYSDFVEGVKDVKVERESDSKAKVTYQISMMGQDIHYTLEHIENLKNGEMSWRLIESNFIKANQGKWILKDLGDGTAEATYEIEIEFNISVPSFILNRLVKGNLPSMIQSFEKQAKKRHGK